LLYSRFFTKVLADAGLLEVQEPFTNLLTQGMVVKDGAKMSKSKGNVVSPEHIVAKYGADAARLFILFAAPPERDLEWSDAGIEGSSRFLNRVWRLITGLADELPKTWQEMGHLTHEDQMIRRITHATVKKVTHDIDERFNFNTAISAVMELVNALYQYKDRSEKFNSSVVAEAIEKLLLILSPFAPHMTEEMWSRLGYSGSIHTHTWPEFDETIILTDEIEMVIQINGKVRERVMVPVDADESSIREQIMAQQKVQAYLEGKTVVKFIVVPGKLANIVIK
jgi:leucyl-tRNA synthetase